MNKISDKGKMWLEDNKIFNLKKKQEKKTRIYKERQENMRMYTLSNRD